jgi:uncharacterized protein YceK
MKTVLLLLCVNLLVGCAAVRFQPDSWRGRPNPLDSIEGQPTVDDLHTQNVRTITSNPGYRLP